jgi:hypothetical protein
MEVGLLLFRGLESTDFIAWTFCVVRSCCAVFWSLACDRQLDSDQGREPKKST